MREDLYNDFSKKIKTQEQIHFPLEDENSENKIDAVITKKTDFNKFFELFQSRKLVSDIFAIVEDTRVENRIKNKYSGLIAIAAENDIVGYIVRGKIHAAKTKLDRQKSNKKQKWDKGIKRKRKSQKKSKSKSKDQKKVKKKVKKKKIFGFLDLF